MLGQRDALSAPLYRYRRFVAGVQCPLCGTALRTADDLATISEGVVHVTCVEAAQVPPDQWEHLDERALNEFARAAGWASSASG
jgi:Zn ribbon nucleic-acid-binding protein